MRRSSRYDLQSRRLRRGYTAPLIIAALLVVLACTALVLDMLWLQSASAELRRTAEAAALGACRELASDDSLRTNSDPNLRAGRARLKAAEIASENLVVGDPLMLNVDPDDQNSDIRIGKEVPDPETGLNVFLDTTQAASAVRVKGERSRSRWNPVALFLNGISGQPVADVIEVAEAGIDNRLTGLRPFAGAPVPALPLAILQNDPGFQRKDTWNIQIEQRSGADQYKFNPDTGAVTQEPDGIPEIVLTTMKNGGKPTDGNVQLIDLLTGLQIDRLADQIKLGWRTDDLSQLDRTMDFVTSPATLGCGAAFSQDVATLLAAQVGQPRIVVLYTNYASTGKDGYGTLVAARPVAGRIMAIQANNDGSCRIVFQPAVVTTRTAVLAADTNVDPSTVEANPYIYKLQLTH